MEKKKEYDQTVQLCNVPVVTRNDSRFIDLAILATNPDRSVLITIVTWHFQFHLVNVSILLKIRILCYKREPFRVLVPLLRHVVPLNDGKCRLTMIVIKGRCVRDALPHTFNVGVKKNYAAIKHIYN